jgi:hypothetical protein
MNWQERLGLTILRASVVLQLLALCGLSRTIVVGHYEFEPLKILMVWTCLIGFPISACLLRKRFEDPEYSLWLILNIPGFLFFAFGFWLVAAGRFKS